MLNTLNNLSNRTFQEVNRAIVDSLFPANQKLALSHSSCFKELAIFNDSVSGIESLFNIMDDVDFINLRNFLWLSLGKIINSLDPYTIARVVWYPLMRAMVERGTVTANRLRVMVTKVISHGV